MKKKEGSHAGRRNPPIGSLVNREIDEDILGRLRKVMRQVRCPRRHSQIAHIRIPISLRTIEQHLLPIQSRAIRTSRLRLVAQEHPSIHVNGVHAIEPPLREVLVGALEPTGECVRGAEVGGPLEADGGDGHGAYGGGVGAVLGEGVQVDVYVAEAVEAVCADLGAVLAAVDVLPLVRGGHDCDLRYLVSMMNQNRAALDA
jgi:hypothetical protein